MKPGVKAFWDPETHSVSYVVSDPATKRAALIDPVLGFDPASGQTSYRPVERAIGAVEGAGLALEWIIETHVHADHLSAAQYVKERLGGRLGISSGVTSVQRHFGELFFPEGDFPADGSQFDHLFPDLEQFSLGQTKVSVMHTPGHTPACACYLFGDAVFVGDTLLMADAGTGRCDFPGGSAAVLYDSLQRILALDPDTRVFAGHDSGAGGKRAIAWQSTVAEQRRDNIYCREGISRDEYIAMRRKRDAGLSTPRLMLASLQVNICAGRLPQAQANGKRYLKIPLNVLK